MLVDIEKFIYNDKIYSKCNAADKEMIDTCLHGVRQQIETFKDAYKQAQEEIALLKRENKALSDDNELKCELNEKLEKQVKKLCEYEAWRNGCHGSFKTSDRCYDKEKCAECWKEWAIND